jgi:hypothetical protein
MRLSLLFVFAISAILFGCYYDNEEELYPKAPLPASLKVTYESHIKNIMNTSCALSGCHISGGGQIDLSNFSNTLLIADNGKLEDRVILQRNMPPSGPLSSDDQNLIKRWLETGKLEK